MRKEPLDILLNFIFWPVREVVYGLFMLGAIWFIAVICWKLYRFSKR